ncbi:MAG: hypothetical protein R3F65_30380, partial [bacterium]
DVAGGGAPCTAGVGACQAVGTVVCTPRGPACDAVPGQPVAELCDGIDNNCNGAIDDAPECGRELCDNGVDDDGDGDVDCADDDCAAFPGCVPPPVELCDNGIDDDGDRDVDCADGDCADFPGCQPPPVEDCLLAGDEDGNGLADCEDPVCADFPGCEPGVVEDCAAPGDEDGNGLSECEDPACVGTPGCEIPIAPAGEAIQIFGSLDAADPTWERPADDCTPAPGDLHFYEVFHIVNDTGAPQVIDLLATYAGGDGFLHVYATPFDPTAVDGCLVGNDDGFDLSESVIEGVGIGAGEVLAVVVSTFAANAEIGDYDVVIATRAPVPQDPTPIAPRGQSIELVGTLDANAPTWERPNGDCSPSPGDLHYFLAAPIVNETGVAQIIDIAAAFGGDGYLHIFADPFDPAELAGCLAGDDDGPGGINSSLIEGIPMAPGEVLWVVVSTFAANAEIGDVTVTISTRVAEVPGDAQPIAAPGGQIAVGGSIDAADPTWERPNANCTAAPGDLHFYEAFAIVNETGAPQVIDIDASFGDDGYLHVYADPFDPAGVAGCVAGNDDAAPGQTLSSAIGDVEIAAGEVLWVVVSTFAADTEIGDYDVVISTQIPPAPEDCATPGDEDGNGLADCDDAACADFPLCPTPIAPRGDSIAFAGALDAADPTWERPGADCVASPGDRHFYDAIPVINETAFAQTLDIQALFAGGDGFLHVYADPFDPTGVAGCIVGNDDGNGVGDSAIEGVEIAPGEVLWIVVSTFGPNAPIGDYDLTVATRPVEGPGGDPQPIALPGGEISVLGAVDANDPSWERPNANCTASPGDLHFYEAVPIVNQTGRAQTVDIEATFTVDGYLHVFADPFDPTLIAGCIVGNDDAGGTLRSAVAGVDIAAGEVLWVLVSTFNPNVELGDYELVVTTVAPDPEPIAGPGAEIQVFGSIDAADPTWARPDEACGAPAAGRFYEAFPIVNNTGAAQVIDLLATFAGGDGYLHVYAAPFDPASLDNCIVGDDDGPGGVGTSLIEGVDIAAGEVLWVVVSTFAANAPIGDYDVVISTQGEPPAGTSIAAPGGTIQLLGSLDAGDPTWARPSAVCGVRNNVVHFYDAFVIVNDSGAARNIDIDVAFAADGYVHLYRAPFDPANLAQCIAGNDDGPGGVNSSRLTNRAIANGEALVIVVSTFSQNAAIGPYTVTVTTL